MTGNDASSNRRDFVAKALGCGTTAAAMAMVGTSPARAQQFADKIAILSTVENLKTVTPSTIGTSLVFVMGYATEGDGGQGFFVYNCGGEFQTIDSLVIVPNTSTGAWTRLYSGPVSIKWFGARGDGQGHNQPAIMNAIAAVNSLGGGVVYFPSGIYRVTSTIVIGNGSDTQQSSKDHRITLRGEGYGAGAGVTNTQIEGATTILYDGATPTTVIEFAGPLHSNSIENMMIDCNGKAALGLSVIHLTQATFSRVTVRRFTELAYNLTCRSQFPPGVAYGNADNRFYDCYALEPATPTSTAIFMSSGVDYNKSLAGQPDTARCLFFGGTYMYGGATGFHGVSLNGADNNQFFGCFFYPGGGGEGGYDIWLQQWFGSGDFPKENNFVGCGMTRGVSGNGGVGSNAGNVFWPFQVGDGASQPTLPHAQSMSYEGNLYINGRSTPW